MIALVVGLAALGLCALFGRALVPPLELRGEGEQPQREKFKVWTRREGGWLVRTIIALLIGSVLTLLIQRLV